MTDAKVGLVTGASSGCGARAYAREHEVALHAIEIAASATS